MISNPDYIPARDSELVSWSANFVTVVTENASAWGITSAEVTLLQDSSDNFAALQAQADSPLKNAIIEAEKKAARKKLEKVIRELAGFRLKNPIITDVQRLALGLHVRDTTPTTIPVPVTRPEINIEVFDVRRLKIRFHDKGSDSKAKPYGTNGAVIFYAVLDAPPASPAELTRSVLATRTPHLLEFADDERGKTVYVAICWQNEKGEKGPWSEVESALVP